MSNPNQLIDEVDSFYEDVINIIEERIKNMKIKLDISLEREENLNEEIKNNENEIKEIINRPENHINDNIQFRLLPKMEMKVDKFKKNIDYLNQELDGLRIYNEDERKVLSSNYNKYIKEIEKYYDERNSIIKCIVNKKLLEKCILNFIDRQKISEIREQNDAIFNQYLPNSNDFN